MVDLPACVAPLEKADVTFGKEMEIGPAGKQIQIEDPHGKAIDLSNRHRNQSSGRRFWGVQLPKLDSYGWWSMLFTSRRSTP